MHRTRAPSACSFAYAFAIVLAEFGIFGRYHSDQTVRPSIQSKGEDAPRQKILGRRAPERTCDSVTRYEKRLPFRNFRRLRKSRIRSAGVCARCTFGLLQELTSNIYSSFTWDSAPSTCPDHPGCGPAVNEASRIAAMCRSLDQPVLTSAAFADVGDMKRHLVSVGRYALRGVSHSQELFTLDPDA